MRPRWSKQESTWHRQIKRCISELPATFSMVDETLNPTLFRSQNKPVGPLRESTPLYTTRSSLDLAFKQYIRNKERAPNCWCTDVVSL
jgi:hypothetical protein